MLPVGADCAVLCPVVSDPDASDGRDALKLVLTVPTGRLVSGLPARVQADGAYLEDHTRLRFATLVQERLGGSEPSPGLGERVMAG
jgi:hypothetical protein